MSFRELDLRIQARRDNLQEEAIYMNHAFNGGPLLRQAATDQPQRDRSQYEAMRDHARESGFWLN